MADAAGGERVTVVVTACTVFRGLSDALRELRAQADEEGAEVLVAFNTEPSAISADDLASLEPLVDRVLFEPRPGKSAALNTAVAGCNSEILAFTDDDAIPAPGWLAAIVAPLRADGGLAGAGGRVRPVFPEGGPPRWYRRLVHGKDTHFLGPKHDLGDAERDYVHPTGGSISPTPLGANCAWRRDVLLRIPYREELGPNRTTGMRGGEDTCVALEVMDSGERVRYVPGALVEHPVTHERMTKEYVIEGFRLQGLEYGTILSLLGRTVPGTSKMRRKAMRRDAPWWLRSILGPYGTFKREIRSEFARGACASLSLV
ncbi:MAG: glycosyltransferase [Planctomycetota bacterium]